MNELVRSICAQEGLPCRTIQVETGGQVNQVFLVDGQYIVRVGGRADALTRLKHETELLQSLEGKIRVPKVYAFGQVADFVYQIQQFIPGQKLYRVWKDLSPDAQETIADELAETLKVIHSLPAPFFGDGRPGSQPYTTWEDYLAAGFYQTLAEFEALGIRMAPGMLELAVDFFESHRHVLEGGRPALVHGDFTLVNLLVDNGRLAALLDFEYSLHAPFDYELYALELFCLYPNDYAEEGHEIYCTADFAGLFPLLRKYYPALFEAPNARERLDVYQVYATLGSHLGWRKANLSTIPPDRMAAKGHYMARLTNFTFSHGVRIFYA